MRQTIQHFRAVRHGFHLKRYLRGGPVSRILSKRLPSLDDHSSAAPVTGAVKLPTRTPGLKCPCGGLRHRLAAVADLSTRGPYSALLRVGLAVPSLLPRPRWALTPPFHPYPASGAVSSLWRFPWGYPRRALPGTLPSWSPDFPRDQGPAVIQPSAQAAGYPSSPLATRAQLLGCSFWGAALWSRGTPWNPILPPPAPSMLAISPKPGACRIPCPLERLAANASGGSIWKGANPKGQAQAKARAIASAVARSSAVSSPLAQGRKRRRKAARRAASGASG